MFSLFRCGLLLAFTAVCLQIAVFLQPLLPKQYQIAPVCETITKALLLPKVQAEQSQSQHHAHHQYQHMHQKCLHQIHHLRATSFPVACSCWHLASCWILTILDAPDVLSTLWARIHSRLQKMKTLQYNLKLYIYAQVVYTP